MDPQIDPEVELVACHRGIRSPWVSVSVEARLDLDDDVVSTTHGYAERIATAVRDRVITYSPCFTPVVIAA